MTQLIERHAIDYIPLAERRGKVWHLWPVWFMGNAHLATLAVGVIGIALGGNLLWTTIAVLGGSALGTFFMAFHSTQGPQLGLPQLIQSRPQFGYMGALLVWVVALIAYIGYNAFNDVLAAQAVRRLAGTPAAADPVVIVVFALCASLLAAVGYSLIHRAQLWLAYLLIAALSVFSVGGMFLIHIPAEQWRLSGYRMTPFLAQFFAAAAYQLSWSIYVSDYSRYLPHDVGVRASFWWTFVGAFIGGTWAMLLGTLAAALYPHVDLPAAMLSIGNAVFPGLGWLLLAAALLGLVTISTLNLYGASLTLLSVADSFRPQRPRVSTRLLALAIVTAVSTGIGLASSRDFVNRFADLLTVLLYLFTPWTAINLVDFYWVRRGHYSVREIFNPHGIYGRWNWRGLLAYGVGFVAMIPCFSTGLYTGPIARALDADVSMLVGLPVATIIYLLACRSLDLEKELKIVQEADRDLESSVRPAVAHP
jgi:purine-cytosine permease-like protein